MTWKQVALAVVALDFATLTAWTVAEDGWLMFEHATANLTTITMSADLIIALALACMWMVADARKRGVSAVPWIVLTACLGSLGVLGYLIARESAEAPVPQALSAA